MKALWIAVDGTRHEVVGKDIHDISQKVEKLRRELGKEDPHYTHAQPITGVGKAECAKLPNIEELPDGLRERCIDSVREQWNKPDPSKMN